jgi:hypothetical protein
MTNILVPHGTEYNVLDHFSFFYLDYNLLPSNAIKDNWEYQLKIMYNDYIKYDRCTYLASGRIDYNLLDSKVHNKKYVEGKIVIGIVLTYNSETYQNTYIEDVIEVFEKKFGSSSCLFVIKPRPNRPFVPGGYMKENVGINVGDIYEFLNNIDIVIGTVSTYGILTMVVTDAIYRNIPGFYYIPNDKFSSENLGYSYHDSMSEFTFNDKKTLERYVSSNTKISEFIQNLWQKNLETQPYLTFDKNANIFLEEFILEKIKGK